MGMAEIPNGPPCLAERRRLRGSSCMATLWSSSTTISSDRSRGTSTERVAPADRTARTLPSAAIPRRHPHPGALRWLALGLVYVSLASAAVLLALDAAPRFLQSSARPVVSATPLVAIAAAFLAAQIVLRPAPGELVKRVLLSIAFLLWGGNALFSQYAWAALLNDAAVALFVLDLALITRDHLRRGAALAGLPVAVGREER